MAPETSSVCPGQDLGPADQYISGPGTCVFKGRICSTLLGVRHFTQDSGKSTIVVTPRKIGNDQGEMVDNINLLPAVGNVVLARITRINRLQANAQILVVGETAIPEEFQGVIRLADVRAYEKDKIKIQTSFKPGDIVRAEVISLGDQSSYYLSTSKNELGVLFAWNELGEMMYPASWNSMRTEAGHIEERKVAKPFV